MAKEAESERLRADQIEEERSIAQLQNELLTEMVAAEQVTHVVQAFPWHIKIRIVHASSTRIGNNAGIEKLCLEGQ